MGRRHNAISTVVKIHRNLCEIQYAGRETGSSCNFITARNVVSNVTTMFSGVAVNFHDGRYCIMTATHENMVVTLEITFLSAPDPKL